MDKIVNLIENLSKENKKTVEQIGLKLSEETGECNQAILSLIKADACGYKDLSVEDVKEESVDVALVALSLFFKLGGSKEELVSLFETKMDKWKEKAGVK